MDAGKLTDSGSVLQLSAGSAAAQRDHLARFLNSEANTVLGAFGLGLGIWGKSDYLPFFARSLTQPEFPIGTEPPNFGLGGCFFDERFAANEFFPRWRWESRAIQAWTYPVAQPLNSHPEWFVDVDGDGYSDELERLDGDTGTKDFNRARVRFTRKYGVGDPVDRGPAGLSAGPALMPFVNDVTEPGNSLVPIPGVWDPTPTGRKTRVFYADMNGDGLPDLVTSNFAENDGALRIRPGDGTGHFSCNDYDPWDCVPEATAGPSSDVFL